MTDPARVVTTETMRGARGRTSWTLHESPQAPNLVFCDLIVHQHGGPSIRLERIEVGKLETTLAEIRAEAYDALPEPVWDIQVAPNGRYYVTRNGENVSSGWHNRDSAQEQLDRRKLLEHRR